MSDKLKTPMGVITRTGPSVFLDYDQNMLNACYDQQVWAPNRDDVHERVALACERVRARLGPPQRFAYGPTDIEGIDVYSCGRDHAPVFVYIHGGAWRAGSAALNAAPAALFVEAGVHYAVVDFTNVIATSGDLMPMVDQVRRACLWIYHNASMFGGDRTQIYVHGHSSGGHLTGVLLTTDWAGLYGLKEPLFRAGMVSSGMYDLEPVRLSARSSYVRFTDDVVHALSSIRHIEHIHCPVIVTYGTSESPEFIRQNKAFADALRAQGCAVRLQSARGFNHFELAETFANPLGILGLTALDLVRHGFRDRVDEFIFNSSV
jgi:arylformamidase